MNKINRNYFSKLNLIDTNKAMNYIRSNMISELSEKLDLFEIRQPMISIERNSTNYFSLNKNKRSINFDTLNDNNIHYIYNNFRYWLTNTVHSLDIKNNSGIIVVTNYIDRDIEIKNTESIEKNIINIEYRYDNKDKILDKSLEIKNEIINTVKKIQIEINNMFKIKLSDLPKNIIENKFGLFRNEKTDFINEQSANEGIFILVDDKNFKGLDGIYNSFEITLNAYSKNIDESYEIFRIINRQLVDEIEYLSSESEIAMEEYIFSKNNLLNTELRTINVEIDLDKLGLLLLDKSHILELQAGKNIDDIEKIFSHNNIKHL